MASSFFMKSDVSAHVEWEPLAIPTLFNRRDQVPQPPPRLRGQGLH